MRKRAIHQESRSIWVDENRHEQRVPLTPILEAIGPVVYAIRTKDGRVKIGHTSNLARRCKQVGSGMKSILGFTPGTREDEGAIHRRLDGLATEGREWYPECDEVLAVVNEMRAALGVGELDSLSA